MLAWEKLPLMVIIIGEAQQPRIAHHMRLHNLRNGHNKTIINVRAEIQIRSTSTRFLRPLQPLEA